MRRTETQNAFINESPYQIGDQHLGGTNKLGRVESFGHIVACRCHQDGHHAENGQQVGIGAAATEGARQPRRVIPAQQESEGTRSTKTEKFKKRPGIDLLLQMNKLI